MGFTLFLAVLTIVGNLLADVLYAPGRSAYSGEVMMILSYLASRRRQRQAAIPALAHITPSPWRQGGDSCAVTGWPCSACSCWR